MDVSSEVARDYWHETRAEIESLHTPSSRFSAFGTDSSPASHPTVMVPSDASLPSNSPTYLETSPGTSGPGLEKHPFQSRNFHQNTPPTKVFPGFEERGNDGLCDLHTPARSAAAHLLSLRNTAPQQPQPPMIDTVDRGPESTNVEPYVLDPIAAAPSPFNEDFIDDGIFIPGSTYQQLHSTLRDHIFSTARSGFESSQRLPDERSEPITPGQRLSTNEGAVNRAAHIEASSSHDPAFSFLPFELPQHEEHELLKTYIEEVAPWVSTVALDYVHSLQLI